MDRITCTCGWDVTPGLDCDFCGASADSLRERAEALVELIVLDELARDLPGPASA